MNEVLDKNFEKIREKIRAFPTTYGLYFMKDSASKVLYVGKAKNLRSRAMSYFQESADMLSSRGPKIVEMINKVADVDYLETETEVDAMLQEARLIKDIRPLYNTELTDDKTFPYLEITKEDFAGVYVTRKPASSSRLFGPFANSRDLRVTLAELQKIFKFRTCRLEIDAKDEKRRFFRPCLLYSIRQCAAPCAAYIEPRDYKKIIADLIKFMQSKRAVVMRGLQKQMEEAAKTLDYEKAGMFRDRMKLIEQIDKRGEPDENVQPEVFANDPTAAIEELQKVLNLPQIRIIEGIDAAHISGSDAVGSLVKFIDGRPFKSGYRRFKINTVEGIDDYAMIAEIVRRRYKYAVAGEELWPDLILIDGGQGQLHATGQVLKELNAPAVKLASLAKREDEIFTESSNKPLKLPRTSAALKLLQYVRDEAHRFAQHYHHILRDKRYSDK